VSLRLYDTASRKLEPVTSTNGTTTMYCCGLPFIVMHMWKFKNFPSSDLVRRVLTVNGVNVKLIQNITDVGHMSEDIENEDKMLAQAKAESIDPIYCGSKI